MDRTVMDDTATAIADKVANKWIELPVARLALFLTAGLLLSLLLVGVVALYEGQEGAFYYWDYAAYQDMSTATAVYWRDLSGSLPGKWLQLAQEVWVSTAQDYSNWYTLPLVPLLLIFGDGRFVYILAITLLYQLPLLLVLGGVATRLIESSGSARWQIGLIAFSIVFFIPTLWQPTLRGYPDTGAAALVWLAVWLYLREPTLASWWQRLGLGLLLAAAILFRRHFAYEVVAFASTLGLHQFWLQKPWLTALPWRERLQPFWRIGTVGFLGMGSLLLAGWPFVERAWQTDYSSLYAAYVVPFSLNVTYYVPYYGLIVLAAAGAGYLLGWRLNLVERKTAVFILLFGGLSTALWLLLVRQLGYHYTYHFTPAIALGLITLFWVLYRSLHHRFWRPALLSLACAWLLLNFIGALVPDRLYSRLPAAGMPLLWSANHPPLVQPDYHILQQLLFYLRQQATPHDPILVAASSGIINSDLLWHAERRLAGGGLVRTSQNFWQNQHLNIIQWVPFADSRDPYPLEDLLAAEIIVIATPIQYHLQSETQEVVAVVVDLFRQDWPLAQDFKRMDRTFRLHDGTVLTLYQRVAATKLGTAIKTVQQMEAYVTRRPGGQGPWINLSGRSDIYLTNAAGKLDWSTENWTAVSEGINLLYIDPLPEIVTLSGQIQPYNHCPGSLQITVSRRSQTGQTLAQQSLHTASDDTHFSFTFPNMAAEEYLLLSVTTNDVTAVTDCWLIMSQIQVLAE